jgi:hypothetical protein
LPANAVGQLKLSWLKHRHRRQASSHSFKSVSL